ncbi:MAG TPA: hypothetical protein VJG13_09000, partial [Thermoanaerobaculia bacterium]|nr:hypothetical protein [Thermoanaerobaculia bacterium]
MRAEPRPGEAPRERTGGRRAVQALRRRFERLRSRLERLPARPRPPGWLAAAAGALAVAAVAASLYFPRLGEAPLFGDEAIHALVA